MGMARIVWQKYEEAEGRAMDLAGKLQDEWDRNAAIIEQCRDWKARTRILAKRRDEAEAAAQKAEGELHKLRRSRAAGRAAPAPAAATAGLLVECRDGLLGNGHKGDLVHRLEKAIAAAEPCGPKCGDAFLEPNAWAEERLELQGRVAFMDQRVKELSGELGTAKAALSNTQKVLDNTVKERDEERGKLKECERLYQRAKADVDALEEQAEGYRKTITKLRLTRGDRTARRFEGADGPDIRDPNHADAGGESYGGTS